MPLGRHFCSRSTTVLQDALRISAILVVFATLLTANTPSARTGTSTPLSAESSGPLAFTSTGGHVVGFEKGSVYVAAMDHLLSVDLVGARDVPPTAVDNLTQEGENSATPLPLSRVTYPGVWPGVTVVYEGKAGSILKSSYHIDAGIKGMPVNQIRLRYNRPVRLDDRGNLIIAYETGAMTEAAPVAWQEINHARKPIDVAFVILSENEVGFSLGDYDPDLPLVIDPSLTWNTFLGGTGTDNATGITSDASGNVYVTGYSDVSWGTPVRAHSGGTDVYVAKLASDGSIIWSTFLGGSNSEQAAGIAVDGSGNVYVAGTSGAGWGTPVRAYSAANDAFAAKLASSGALTWHTFLGAAGTDVGGGIAVDGSGNVYVTGQGGTTWGTPVRAYSLGYDGFAVKLASNGTLLWSTFLGGTGNDYGAAVTRDGNGNVYVAGYSDATWATPLRAFSGTFDAFAVKLASNGTISWNTFLGGAGNEVGTGIALDVGGNVYVEGASSATWGTPVQAHSAAYDGFAAKLVNNGSLVWNTFFGGAGTDQGYGIAVDGDGSAFVVGASDATWGSPVWPYNAGFDVFAVKLAGDGSRTWSTFLGSGTKDIGRAIAVDGNGNVYFGGESDATWGTPSRAYSALDDAFVVKVQYATDTDGDGLWDHQEDANADADNDPATNPGPDTDGDTFANYLDADDDDDGTPTANENADPNGDGDPRDALDNDWDGQPDYLDLPTGISSGIVDNEQKISDLVGGLSATLDDDDRFGTSVASIGDLDGDGINDIVEGAQYDDDGGTNRGAVHVLFLNANGTIKAEQKISNTTGGLTATFDNSDLFGIAVAGIGDLDGDGTGDIAVGALNDDDGGTNRGAVHILFLNADGTVKGEQKISNTTGGLAAILDDGDGFGMEVAAIGDLDGDGINDIAVGAYLDDDGGADRGALYILFLNADGTVKGEQKISNTAGGLTAPLDDSDLFGISAACIGDLDGDNIIDIAVGAEWDDDGGADRGAVHILFLNADGTVRTEQKLSDTTGGLTAPFDDNDYFGNAVAGCGDLNGDGTNDIVVTAMFDDDGGSDRGAVHVLFLNTDGTVNAEQKISNTAGGLTAALEDGDRFGISVAGIGDLDGDGPIDIAVGAHTDDDGGTDRGAVYVLNLAEPTIPHVLVVDTAADTLDGDTSSNGYLAINKGADGRISLREAIMATNNTAGTDTIRFAIALTDTGHVYYADDSVADTLSQVVHTTLDDASIADFDPDYPGGALAGYSWYRIQVKGTPLPAVTDTLLVDAKSQAGFAGKPIVELDGSLLGGAGEDGLLVTGGASTIRGFAVNRFPGSGIELTTGGGNTVAGNYLGTNITGTYAAENGGQGVLIDGSADNVIGGTTPADRNVLSGNHWRGILIQNAGATGNEVKGNYIGTDFLGLSPLPNPIGVYIYEAPNNTIGGTAAGAGNVISGNPQFGVYVVFAGSTGNKIQGNTIGLNATRSAAIPNGFAGIELLDAPGNMVGGPQLGARNIIAHNDSIGVSVGGTTTTDIAILSNEIYGHPGLGIDLARDGVTLNDSADIDTGHNDRLNFPVITSAVEIGGTVNVDFELDLPASDYRIEFFTNPSGANPTGYGEGETLADTVSIVHTGSGVESFSHAFPGSAGDTLTATTTECLDPGCTTFGSTSEFSQVVAVASAHNVTGRVFEDAVITGGVGQPFSGGQGDAGISGARVELFNASDAFQTFTTTNVAGVFTFTDVPGGASYRIRVVASSLDAGVGALPDQTFESDGTTNYGTFGTAMGGQDAVAADTTAQSTLTSAEHWVQVSIDAANVTGVDFGFSYELIVNTNDDGQGSLRRFLDNANAIVGIQTSRFNIPTTDPNYSASPLAYTIKPLSPLPEITDPTIVSGTSQPDFTATPIIELDGSLAGATANGLWISAGGSTVRGLVIRQFTQSGIYVSNTGGNTIAGNYIGPDVTGLLDRGNAAQGIHIDTDTGGNTMGGTTAGLRNLISGNGANGIYLQATTANIIHGNYIGVDKNGAPNLGNDGHGILINGGDNNAIGGTTPGEGNLISGNTGSGVAVTG